MSEQGQRPDLPGPPGREPIFLLPGVVAGLAGLLVAIQLATSLVLNEEEQVGLFFWFAFQPYRFLLIAEDASFGLPLLWTPFTHALMHAGWEHLVFNTAWLAIFGTPVARRYGGLVTLTLFFISAAAGAALFAATTLYEGIYLLGASGGVAGLTGAALRFMFQPVVVGRHPQTGEPVVLGRRLAGIGEVFISPRTRYFALIWLMLNAAVPLVPVITGQSLAIAWQAHLGGFAAGLLLVGLFERRG